MRNGSDYERRCYEEDLDAAEKGGQSWFSFDSWLSAYRKSQAEGRTVQEDEPDEDIEF